jgi:HAD superfamily hydrolase (TIGR01509 family)
MIKGLIFDFDGLILDTELPNLHAWQEIYRKYGYKLPFEKYVLVIGSDESAFNPLNYLVEISGNKINPVDISIEHQEILFQKLAFAELMPGVKEYLETAKKLRLLTAIASSSNDEWVFGHLERLGAKDYFDSVITAGPVLPAKPNPTVYEIALKSLGCRANQAIAFEDSKNGVRAARIAGIFCVAVPNSVTVHMDFFESNLQIPSLLTLSLPDLIAIVESS